MAAQKKVKAVLDLGGLGLDSDTLPTPAAEATGRPLTLKVADIDPDPNQPRKEFPAKELAELAASIKEQGVLQPIIVRPHPDMPGRWMVKFGERRLRASKEAGLDEIPGYVSDGTDDIEFAQVVENLQRDDLKPMELAQFIQRKLTDGLKKAEIARKLGVDGSIITSHLALIDPPPAIEQAYASGKTTSPKTIYELRSLHDKFPEAVAAWIDTAAEITRAGVAALADELKGKKTPKTAPQEPNADESLGHDQETGGQGNGEDPDGKPEDGETNPSQKPADAGQSGGNGEDRGSTTSWPAGKVAADPDLIKKPLLLVEIDGRSAAVLLNRRPSDAGRLRIRFEDNGADEEVAAEACKIHLLVEQPK